MKTRNRLILTCAFYLASFMPAINAETVNADFRAALTKGAELKTLLTVEDDDKKPIEGAEVQIVMPLLYDNYLLNGVTDSNGCWVVNGTTTGNGVVYNISKEGFYPSKKKISLITMGAEHEVKNGKWQPYGAKERLVLRRIPQTPEIVQYKGIMDVPTTNEWLGLDLEKKDFVNPYGKGEVADLEIKVEWDGLPAWKSQYCALDMRLSGRYSGGYYENNVTESEFPYPYRANLDNAFLERGVRIVDRANLPSKTKIPFPQDKSLVIRSRVVVDKKENITSAHYGCIRKLEIGPSRRGKALLVFSYVFNQVSNDTNLEALER